MKTCRLEKIADFKDYAEFDRFVEWLNELAKSGEVEKLPVQKHYADATTLREMWFRHSETGKIWRLVWPDAPFRGIFEPVE